MTDELSIINTDLNLISEKLANSLHLHDVIYSFYERKIISQREYDEFMNNSYSENTKASRFVKYVAKNPGTIRDFIEALLKEGLTEIADHISSSTVNSVLPRSSDNGMSTKILPFFSMDSEKKKELPATSVFPDFYKSKVPLTIKVKSTIHKFGCEGNNEIYKNSSNPQGCLFIANVFSFENNNYPARLGSNVDVKNLKELFVQIGYKVLKPYLNPTKYELLSAMHDLTKSKILSEVDSCVVVIMSHGRGEMAFLTSDNKVIHYQEILELFNNRGCPSLFGKPKLFIFQCCRGPTSDDGVGFETQFVSNTVDAIPDTAIFGETMVLHSSPSFTDIYIIHSSLSGFVSYRCPERGSWLVETICRIFMEYSCSKDLDSLMRLVSRNLKSFYSNKGKKQICVMRNIGFDKLLYFNPISTPDFSGNQNFDETDCLSPLGAAPYKKIQQLSEMCMMSQRNHKRQLSNSSNVDGDNLCKSLMEYLQINDMSEMLTSAEKIQREIQKKIQNKRIKMDPS